MGNAEELSAITTSNGRGSFDPRLRHRSLRLGPRNRVSFTPRALQGLPIVERRRFDVRPETTDRLSAYRSSPPAPTDTSSVRVSIVSGPRVLLVSIRQAHYGQLAGIKVASDARDIYSNRNGISFLAPGILIAEQAFPLL